ncbi:hypothetical protein BC830DRAFT_1170224 [Chytriomyces sp. MP71]|nr:hypothetical protein BC830DRAFT_1170224 [Chytriomyces sp. MP71]
MSCFQLSPASVCGPDFEGVWVSPAFGFQNESAVNSFIAQVASPISMIPFFNCPVTAILAGVQFQTSFLCSDIANESSQQCQIGQPRNVGLCFLPCSLAGQTLASVLQQQGCDFQRSTEAATMMLNKCALFANLGDNCFPGISDEVASCVSLDGTTCSFNGTTLKTIPSEVQSVVTHTVNIVSTVASLSAPLPSAPPLTIPAGLTLNPIIPFQPELAPPDLDFHTNDGFVSVTTSRASIVEQLSTASASILTTTSVTSKENVNRGVSTDSFEGSVAQPAAPTSQGQSTNPAAADSALPSSTSVIIMGVSLSLVALVIGITVVILRQNRRRNDSRPTDTTKVNRLHTDSPRPPRTSSNSPPPPIYTLTMRHPTTMRRPLPPSSPPRRPLPPPPPTPHPVEPASSGTRESVGFDSVLSAPQDLKSATSSTTEVRGKEFRHVSFHVAALQAGRTRALPKVLPGAVIPKRLSSVKGPERHYARIVLQEEERGMAANLVEGGVPGYDEVEVETELPPAIVVKSILKNANLQRNNTERKGGMRGGRRM